MPLTRRRFVETAAMVPFATVIAGCQGGGGDGGGGGGDTTTTSSDTETTTAGGNDTTTTEAGGGAEVTVDMVDFQFDPRNLEVETGTTVVWENKDGAGHTVTNASSNWSFDKEVAGGGSTSHTFDSSGVYDVYCKFHGGEDLSGMSMKIAVGGATIEKPLGQGGGDTTTTTSGDGGGGGYY